MWGVGVRFGAPLLARSDSVVIICVQLAILALVELCVQLTVLLYELCVQISMMCGIVGCTKGTTYRAPLLARGDSVVIICEQLTILAVVVLCVRLKILLAELCVQ